MKKDFLKEFVAENRDAFDQYEPGADVLDKIRSRLEPAQPAARHRAKVFSLRYWPAAAAIVAVIVGITLLFQQSKMPDNPVAGNTSSPAAPKAAMPDNTDTAAVAVRPSTTAIAVSKTERTTVKKQKKVLDNIIDTNVHIDSGSEVLASNTRSSDDWKQDLKNANSSSTRLAAILAAGREDGLSGDDLQTLANTMNNDESSNVRLAALDVLKKQRNQATVRDLILPSVAKQDDPIVQMELLSMLSPEEANSVKKQLLEITQNPMNIEAVRDQAYAALLRSKSNF